MRYLWIDLLYIIQGDPEDWEGQAKLMEKVYTSAYFTIAATSAEDINASFLKRTGRRKQHICLKNSKEQVFYASDSLTSFDKEVDNSELNNRAWVLQKRLCLAEPSTSAPAKCTGSAATGYTADLTRLKTSEVQKKSFRLNSEFSRLLHRSGVGYTMYFI